MGDESRPASSSGAEPEADADPDLPGAGRRRDRRTHIMQVTVEVAATVGFRTMVVEDIAATARIGPRTFYRYFPNKQAAFEAGHQLITMELRARARQALDSATDPLERAFACLGALAEFFASDPARAGALLIEAPSASEAAIALCEETMAFFRALLAETTASLPPHRRVPPIVAEMTVGGVREVVYARAVRGELDELPSLVPALVQTLMTPYLGVERARQASSGVPGTAPGRDAAPNRA